jgi:hypothetical protein
VVAQRDAFKVLIFQTLDVLRALMSFTCLDSRTAPLEGLTSQDLVVAGRASIHHWGPRSTALVSPYLRFGICQSLYGAFDDHVGPDDGSAFTAKVVDDCNCIFLLETVSGHTPRQRCLINSILYKLLYHGI